MQLKPLLPVEFPLRRGLHAAARPGEAILRPGRNCWCIASCERAAVLVDGADYFAALAEALGRARHRIFIIGWDFDGGIKLSPDREGPTLGSFLRSLVEARAGLEIRILVWNLSTIHAPGATLPLLFGDSWQDHPNIQLQLDGDHPLYGAQHQKIVCVDDKLAFVGGIDLTVDRWDTAAHRPDDGRRLTPEGQPYAAVHDLQMAVDGEAARQVALLARQRWRSVTGEEVPGRIFGGDPWPPSLQPEFKALRVAIARTAPRWHKEPWIGEGAALTEDAILAARRFIYIEAQYLANASVVKLMAKSLGRPHGPEILVLTTRSSHGKLEQLVMGRNRDRMIRRLKRADLFDRFRVYYPVAEGPQGDCEILVHSKLFIVDDRLLRIGSSNLNNRSVGLDRECDLAIEAGQGEGGLDEGEEATRRAIAGLRDRLLAEHLDCTPEEVAAAVAATGSLVAAVERLNVKPRGLRPFSGIDRQGPVRSIIGTSILDPKRPFRLLPLLRRLIPRRYF